MATTIDSRARLSEFGIEQTGIDLLRLHRTTLSAAIPAIVEAHHGHLATTEYAPLVRWSAIDTVRDTRCAHWRLLLGCDVEAILAHHVERMTPHLAAAGFPRAAELLAWEWFAVEFCRFVDRSQDLPTAQKPALRTALIRLVFLDAHLARLAAETVWLD